MAHCQGTDVDEGEAPDFTFNPAMLQGRLKQQCLGQFGFHLRSTGNVAQITHIWGSKALLRMLEAPEEHAYADRGQIVLQRGELRPISLHILLRMLPAS